MKIEDQECCPEFDPSKWDKKTFHWKNKQFLKESIPTIFHIPFPATVGKRITKMMELADKAEANIPDKTDALVLFRDPSAFRSEILYSVTKTVSGATNANVTGTYTARVFEGSYRSYLAQQYAIVVLFISLYQQIIDVGVQFSAIQVVIKAVMLVTGITQIINCPVTCTGIEIRAQRASLLVVTENGIRLEKVTKELLDNIFRSFPGRNIAISKNAELAIIFLKNPVKIVIAFLHNYDTNNKQVTLLIIGVFIKNTPDARFWGFGSKNNI
jgi:hypothetical protein